MNYETIQKYEKQILESKLDSYTYEDLGDILEESMNETCEPFKIGSLEYPAGQVLREIDPIAFSQDVTIGFEEVINSDTKEVLYYEEYELSDFIDDLESGDND